MAIVMPTHIRHGSNIGQPLTRREGVLKVTGAAHYAADNHPPGMLHAVMAVASIARGRVFRSDSEMRVCHSRCARLVNNASIRSASAG